MKLRAKILKILKPDTYYSGGSDEPIFRTRKPKWVEIITDLDESGGYFIYYYDSRGELITDDWQVTLDECKSEVKYECGIIEEEWYKVDDDDDLRNQNK